MCAHGIVCVHMGIVCVYMGLLCVCTQDCVYVCTWRLLWECVCVCVHTGEDPGSVGWGLGPGGWADGGGRVLGD